MITHHQQSFYESARELLSYESERLSQLVGRSPKSAWLARESDGTWFNDEPAILVFDDMQIEIAVYQVGLLAITWNTVDVHSPANWLGCWDWPDDDVQWKIVDDGPIQCVIGQRLKAIHIVDYNSHGFGCGAHAVQFHFDSNVLAIYNALDELGVSNEPFQGSDYVMHPIAD